MRGDDKRALRIMLGLDSRPLSGNEARWAARTAHLFLQRHETTMDRVGILYRLVRRSPRLLAGSSENIVIRRTFDR